MSTTPYGIKIKVGKKASENLIEDICNDGFPVGFPTLKRTIFTHKW